MTHAINLEIRRFYHIYVHDPTNSMTDMELIERAKELALENENNIELIEELEMEPHDILRGSYGYPIED